MTHPPDIPGLTKNDPELTNYLRRFASWANAQFSLRSPDTQAIHGVLLLSPDNSAFIVKVANDGTLSATKVTPGTHP